MFDEFTDTDTGVLQVLPELTDEDKKLMSVGPKDEKDFQRLEELTGQDASEWKIYFGFKKRHGDPVHVPSEGKLVFPDGWCYSASRPAGPSYPPPVSPAERKRLILLYWECRRNYTVREANALRGLLADPRCDQTPEAFEGPRQRLAWLEQDAVECTAKLRELDT